MGVGLQDHRLVSGPVRFVLSSGGHIAGIVNPPSPKAWSSRTTRAAGARVGRGVAETAQRKPGTWWEDWARWAGETAGDMIDPPAIGNDEHPVLGDAPGRYVHT